MEPQQQSLDITKTEQVNCQKCGGMFFDNAVLIRRVSKFYTATGRDEPVPIPVFICKDCNTPLKAFFPNIPDVTEKLGFSQKKPTIELGA
jgi:hypothetical protein